MEREEPSCQHQAQHQHKIFHFQLSVKSGIQNPIHQSVIWNGNQALLRYNVQQRATFSSSRVLSVVTDKWEQFSGKSVLFAAIMYPFTSLAAWAAPQVRPVKSRPVPPFFRDVLAAKWPGVGQAVPEGTSRHLCQPLCFRQPDSAGGWCRVFEMGRSRNSSCEKN